MRVASMLLQFLVLWVFAFVGGLIAAAWFDVSDTLVLYGLMLGIARLAAWRFTCVHQRGFAADERRQAVLGMAGIALGVHMAFQALLAQISTPGATLFPPLDLSVTLAFTALLAPAYGAAAWYCVQAADRSFERVLARRLERSAMPVQAAPPGRPDQAEHARPPDQPDQPQQPGQEGHQGRNASGPARSWRAWPWSARG